MGLENSNTQLAKIVTIVGGKFTVRLKDDDQNPDAFERVLEKGPNVGKTVKELRYDSLSGTIVGGEVHETEYGQDLHLSIEDEGEKFILSLPVGNQYFQQVVKRMPNIDPSKPVVFVLGYDKERQRNFIFIRQDGASVKMAFTKENPNGMPNAEKKVVCGKDKLDFEAQDNFLYGVAVDFLCAVEFPEGAQDEPDREQEEGDDDGVPF